MLLKGLENLRQMNKFFELAKNYVYIIDWLNFVWKKNLKMPFFDECFAENMKIIWIFKTLLIHHQKAAYHA